MKLVRLIVIMIRLRLLVIVRTIMRTREAGMKLIMIIVITIS